MAITKRSISGSEKSVPAKHQQSKRLRCAAIVFNYRHYVAAYPPGRVHRAVPPNQNRQAAVGRPMDSRNQARWLSGYRLSFLPARSGVRRGPAILSGAPKAERKAAPEHIINVSYPGLSSIEQHI